MVASDGGVFTFGDAHFYGALAPFHYAVADRRRSSRRRPGKGYWIETADGDVFGFGDAHA